MTRSVEASNRRRIAGLLALQLAVVLCCAVLAFAIRATVASESFGDAANLAIVVSTGLVLLAAALLSLRRSLAKDRRGERLATALLPLGLVAVCAGFVAASAPDASVEMEAMVEARETPAPAATIELGPRGRDVRLSGELSEGAAKRLAALLEANPQVTRIALTSEGGLADEGQALGDVIARHGLTTFVPDYCVSACTLAFVRGRQRLVLDDARVGFHSPFEEGLFGTVYSGDSSEQRAEYLAAGVAADFVDAALKVKPEDVWYPTPARMIAAHVATGVAARDALPDSNLDGAATLDGARTVILRNFPVLDAFRLRSPDALDTVARWYLSAYRRERSEGENDLRLRAIVRSAVAVALARADDPALVAAARYLARGMAAAADDEACARIGSEADLVEAENQLGRTDEKADATAASLVAAAASGHRDLHATRAEPATAGDGDDADCAASRRAMDSILQRPVPEAAAALRPLVDAQALSALAELQAITARP